MGCITGSGGSGFAERSCCMLPARTTPPTIGFNIHLPWFVSLASLPEVSARGCTHALVTCEGSF